VAGAAAFGFALLAPAPALAQYVGVQPPTIQAPQRGVQGPQPTPPAPQPDLVSQPAPGVPPAVETLPSDASRLPGAPMPSVTVKAVTEERRQVLTPDAVGPVDQGRREVTVRPASADRGGDTLPVTGGDLLGLAAMGAAAVAVGTVLVRRSRRSRAVAAA